ncbi:hypothetical protein BH11BAC1_BH11BAC1_01010 [soil metagenome]
MFQTSLMKMLITFDIEKLITSDEKAKAKPDVAR